ILVRHAFVLEQNPASNAVVWQGISGQYDGKSASRLRAKPSGRLYSVFPLLSSLEKQSVYVRYKTDFDISHGRCFFRLSVHPF
ncbi:hypothetical protein, partial [Ruminococcus sp.]